MRYTKWRVEQVTEKGDRVRVNVMVEEYDGDVMEVEGAADLISWEDDTDEDILKPVRVMSGYLRVIDDGSGVVEMMMPTNNQEHYVEVWKNDQVVWIGYMEAAEYSTPWDIAPRIVELPIRSGLSVLDSIYMDGTKEMKVCTLAELVDEAIEASGAEYGTLIFPKEIAEKEGGDYTMPWRLEVSRFAFFEVSDAKNYDDPEYNRYDGVTYMEMLTEVCKLYGWTLMERAQEVWLLSDHATTYYNVAVSRLKQYASGAPATGLYEQEMMEVQLADLDWASVDHTRKILQGCNKVTVTGKVKAVGDVLPSIDVESQEYIADAVWRADMDVTDGGVRARIIQRAAKSKDGSVEAVGWNNANPDQWDNHNINPVNYSSRVLLVEVDLYDKDTKKHNYDYKSGVRINVNSTGLTEATSTANPILTMKSYEECVYTNGAIVISAQAEGVFKGEFSDPNNIKRSYTTNGKCMLPMRLRIGNKWWNGTKWTGTSPAIFQVRVGADDSTSTEEGIGKIVNTKTLSMPYNGAEGYVIPINEALQGTVRIQLFVPWDKGTSDVIYLSNLTVQYVPEDTKRKHVKEGDNVYKAVLKNGYKGEYGLEVGLTTMNNNPAAYTILTKGGADVKELYYQGRGLMRPEEALLGTLKATKGRRVEVLSIEVEDDEKTNIFTRIKHGEKTYRVLSEKVDVMRGTKRVMIVSSE